MQRFLMLAGLCAVLCSTSCQSEKGEAEVETKYLVTKPLRRDTLISNEYVCQIRSIRNIEVRALERGYLQHIYIDEGQFVKEGQPLFKIMPRMYEAELKKAQAEARVAEIELQNAKTLADSNIVSQNTLAMAQAKFEKANAELALAQVHLDFTQVNAPFDGIIDRLEVRNGSLVDEGELLTTLSDNSKMWVYYNVPEAEYLDYITKAKRDSVTEVRLLMANNQEFSHSGMVETIEGEFNNETGNIAFRATFPNPEGILRHGETGSIIMNVPYRKALIIPQKATFEILDKKYVFVVGDDDVAKLREITVGAEMPDLYIVSEGLSENERILLEGIRKVRDNDKIACEYQQPEHVIAMLEQPAE